MIADVRAVSRRVRRVSRQLLNFVRGACLGLISPMMGDSRRVLGPRVRARTHPRLQLMADSRVNDASSDSPRQSPSAPKRAGGARLRARGAPRYEPFSTVRVEPEFSPRDYVATFEALQQPSCGKLLDLVPARLLCADVFERLAGAWIAEADVVPRLGILLSFERWVMLRDTALAALQPLVARGIRVEVFYAEQLSAGYLCEWFTRGWIVHDVRAAIATLAARGYPSASWRMVIDALARLARAHAPAHELPALLTEIAALALSCGGAVEAETLAREALLYLPESSSATRSHVLRELGTALLCQGQSAAGLVLLDQAFAMAMKAEAPDIGASALYHSGLCALSHGDYPGAERRFRRAIELLSPPIQRPHLLAQAHQSLAVALMHQWRPEAEHHAQTALALRPDPESHLANEDRLLLAKLRSQHRDHPALGRHGASAEADRAPLGLPSARQRDAPEVDV
jgi:tetratricopeptide (TPR) repeat protein